MQKHLTAVAVLFIVTGVFSLLGAGIVFLTVVGGGLASGDTHAMSLGLAIGTAVSSLLIAISVPSLVAGVGLLRQAPWSRIAALIAAGLNLLNMPAGTIVGLYALWVLVQDDSVRILDGVRSSTAATA